MAVLAKPILTKEEKYKILTEREKQLKLKLKLLKRVLEQFRKERRAAVRRLRKFLEEKFGKELASIVRLTPVPKVLVIVVDKQKKSVEVYKV